MHATILSATTIGLTAHCVKVEVDVSFGLVGFHIVGLPDTAIKESTKRIQTALKNCGIPLPAKKITVNLAPADLKKVGALFDLPIALGILSAHQQLPDEHTWGEDTIVFGELSLDGAIRPIKGTLALVSGMVEQGKKRFIVPRENAAEAALISGITVIGASHVTELVAHVRNERSIAPTPPTIITRPSGTRSNLSHIKGQAAAKRAVEIAAAGHHNILFIGSPGSGKTMLAQQLVSLLPPLTTAEILETTKIYSVAGKLQSQTIISDRPFRAPHHSTSPAGLIGGGNPPQPGEITFAHNGVLFLDELAEFPTNVLQTMRQPLEEGTVTIVRLQQSVTFPASALLVAALNPCPCGYFGDPRRNCTCSEMNIKRYLGKLSGPFLDRIDLQVAVQPVTYAAITAKTAPDDSNEMQERIALAHERQRQRFSTEHLSNSRLHSSMLEAMCPLTKDAEKLMERAFHQLTMSARGYHKTLKVARTIADLAGHDIITHTDVQEALLYRSLDNHFDQQRR